MMWLEWEKGDCPGSINLNRRDVGKAREGGWSEYAYDQRGKGRFLETFWETKQQTKDRVDVWVRDLQEIHFLWHKEKS